MSNCPVRYTCPLIDTVLENAETLSDLAGNVKFEDMVVSDLEYMFEEVKTFHQSIMETMEEIRQANSDIREWGEGESSEKDDIEEEKSDLEKQLERAKEEWREMLDEVKELEKQVNGLVAELANLRGESNGV